MEQAIVKACLPALGKVLWFLLVSLLQEVQGLTYNFSLVLIQWHIFLDTYIFYKQLSQDSTLNFADILKVFWVKFA